MRTNGMLIAIDGTAGTGKSTVGKAVAAKLGYGFLSTGEMYRALAYKVFEKNIVPEDHDAVLTTARALRFTFVRQPDATLKMYVDGDYLGDKLHLEEVGNVASRVSTNGEARRVLQLKAAGEKADYDQILKLIEERDWRDSHRAVSPLKPAEDAVIIDTSKLNLQQVTDAVLEKIQHYAA